jgi:hypothetical protein
MKKTPCSTALAPCLYHFKINQTNKKTMKPTSTTITIESDNKKEWTSPEIAELPIEETSQLNPPNVDDQQIS